MQDHECNKTVYNNKTPPSNLLAIVFCDTEILVRPSAPPIVMENRSHRAVC